MWGGGGGLPAARQHKTIFSRLRVGAHLWCGVAEQVMMESVGQGFADRLVSVRNSSRCPVIVFGFKLSGGVNDPKKSIAAANPETAA